ncbi:alpha/beta hydrolase [Pedobacter antarcticus]|uniref:alpha/beta hydrolase n=1 Tax=Pedobacter antarcticus TaxID=34086 RepID=UPI001C5875CB|nr:alpha/beta hydrolase-fold protein [Pedobacter antarcticus]
MLNQHSGHQNRTLDSVFLNRAVQLDLFFPDDLMGNEKLNLLLLNDGQDAAEMGLEEMLAALYADQKIEPLLVVAIHASAERVAEYGVAGIPDYAGRGKRAGAYTTFINQELLPYIAAFCGMPIQGKKGIAGCSLGGLTAFDIAWKNPGNFDLTGVFSGSFWWRSKDLKENYTEQDRIMHEVIRQTAGKPALKFWLMTGTEDETADRNKNGIIDSIDDTIDIIRELLKKDYKRPADIFYYEMVGGKHEVKSWAKAMPAFLIWAFGRQVF